MNKILYTSITSPIGKILIASSPEGICKISLPSSGDGEEDFFSWLKGNFAGYELTEVENKDIPAVEEIRDYFNGKLKDFFLSLDLKGTPFQLKVWEALRTIPYGKIKTYKEIASIIGKEGASRAVGNANRANPVPLAVPCHRVIGTDGTMRGYGGKKGIQVKEFLLRLEGSLE